MTLPICRVQGGAGREGMGVVDQGEKQGCRGLLPTCNQGIRG